MGGMGKGNGVLIFNGDTVAHYMKMIKFQRWMIVMVVQRCTECHHHLKWLKWSSVEAW